MMFPGGFPGGAAARPVRPQARPQGGSPFINPATGQPIQLGAPVAAGGGGGKGGVRPLAAGIRTAFQPAAKRPKVANTGFAMLPNAQPQGMFQQQAMMMQQQQMQQKFKQQQQLQAQQKFKQHQPFQAAASSSQPGAGSCTGELRFDTAEAVQLALQLNGSKLQDATIGVELDPKSKDGTKVLVHGLTAAHQWQELKDHFKSCGSVAFANVKQGTDLPVMGQVRLETPAEAQQALTLSGTMVEGHQILIALHKGSKDGTKLQITGLPPGFEWQELKDFFTQQGLKPAFVETSGGGATNTAEVRYDDPLHAMSAMQLLNGSDLGGGAIRVQLDPASKDGTKLLVSGIASGLEWQEVKDHFNQVGQVAFCNVNKAGAKGKGAGKGKAAPHFNAAMTAIPAGGKMLPNGMMVMANGMIVAAGGI